MIDRLMDQISGMGKLKFLWCLLTSHQWGGSGGSYKMCWRCKYVVKIS